MSLCHSTPHMDEVSGVQGSLGTQHVSPVAYLENYHLAGQTLPTQAAGSLHKQPAAIRVQCPLKQLITISLKQHTNIRQNIGLKSQNSKASIFGRAEVAQCNCSE